MNARRRFTRHATVLPASYAHVIGDLVSEATPSECRTIAAGGCMLVTGEATELVDAPIVVHLELPSGESLDVPGTVVWARDPEGDVPGTMGVRFEAPELLPEPLVAYVAALQELALAPVDGAPSEEPVLIQAADDDAPGALEDPPVATGTLAQTPLPRLLYRLSREAFSGTLLLAGGAEGRVELRDGMPIDAEHPDVPAVWLGRVLVEQGALEQARFDRIVGRQLQLMAAGGESEDTALAALADVSLAQIARARRALLERTLLRLFELDDAEYALHAVEPLPVPAPAEPLDLYRLIHQGIRDTHDEARLARHSSRFAERQARFKPARAAIVERFELDALDRLGIERLQAGPCTLADLVAAGLPDPQARLLLFALYSVDALEIQPVAQVSAQPRART